MLKLNNLEDLACNLGRELIIEYINGQWVITLDMTRKAQFVDIPFIIGKSEEEAESWLTEHLSETAGE